MSCDSFRRRFHGGTDDAALLAHLRFCDRCLDFAAHADPDVMFRALGGSEMIPPGGMDAFVVGVMQQVRVRDAETTVGAARPALWPRRLAIAIAWAWLIAAVWIDLLLGWYQAVASRTPPTPEATYLVLTATVYHLIALHGGALLVMLAAHVPERWVTARR